VRRGHVVYSPDRVNISAAPTCVKRNRLHGTQRS
jgi:hypothetical protein